MEELGDIINGQCTIILFIIVTYSACAQHEYGAEMQNR